MAYKWTVPVVIPINASVSGVNDFGGGASRMGVIMPAAWDAADMTFQVSDTANGTFDDLYTEAGVEVNLAAVDAAKAFSINTSVAYLAPWRFVIVRSGVTALPVVQTAERTMYFVFQR